MSLFQKLALQCTEVFKKLILKKKIVLSFVEDVFQHCMH